MSPHYPVGRYACKVIGQALGEARTGNPQFVLRFKVMGQVDPSDPTRYIPAEQQYERTFYRTITEKTIDYFIEDLKALGFTGKSFSELSPNSSTFQNLKDKDIDMWCAHEEGQDGGTKEKWSVAQVGGEFKVDPLEAKKVRELDNLFGKHLKQLKPAEAKAEAPQTKALPPAMATASQYAPGVDDDSIPF